MGVGLSFSLEPPHIDGRGAILGVKNTLFWCIAGYVAAMAILVMSFRIEWISRDVISWNFEKM